MEEEILDDMRPRPLGFRDLWMLWPFVLLWAIAIGLIVWILSDAPPPPAA